VSPQWGGGRNFGAPAVLFFAKTAENEKSKNQSKGGKSTVLPMATNGPLTKTGFL